MSIRSRYDAVGYSRLAGSYTATCTRCPAVCAYWDFEDLDDDGWLWHDCEGRS